MTEQTFLLLCLFCALAATLGLYILKAFKQTQYRGDERWQAIQLKAEAAANATNWLLLNRIGTLYMSYCGFRNLVELAAVLFFDRQL